jgi:hypothetical protein
MSMQTEPDDRRAAAANQHVAAAREPQIQPVGIARGTTASVAG